VAEASSGLADISGPEPALPVCFPAGGVLRPACAAPAPRPGAGAQPRDPFAVAERARPELFTLFFSHDGAVRSQGEASAGDKRFHRQVTSVATGSIRQASAHGLYERFPDIANKWQPKPPDP
jgi:hypothetical protein